MTEGPSMTADEAKRIESVEQQARDALAEATTEGLQYRYLTEEVGALSVMALMELTALARTFATCTVDPTNYP